MSLLLCFLMCIVLALFFARINNDDKMFWGFLIMFMIGVVGGAVYHKVTSDIRKKVNVSKQQSIQSQSSMERTFILGKDNCIADLKDENIKLFSSKGKTMFYRDSNTKLIVPSKYGKDIPVQNYNKPPNYLI